MNFTRQEKIELVKKLNWDYDVSDEDVLSVIEGSSKKLLPFDKERLFLRSLEHLSWYGIIGLWGVEQAKNMYGRVSNRLFPRKLKQSYDISFAVLQRKPVSVAGWGSERSKQLQKTFLSHRWNRLQPPLAYPIS